MKRLAYALSFAAVVAAAQPALSDPALYETPQDALDALVVALRGNDRADVLEVFGPEAEDLVFTGNPAEDRANRLTLGILYREGYRLVPQDDGSIVIELGADNWPFPIPIARSGDGWAFDVAAGEIEIADREIGANELDVIDLMDAYVDVQAAFRLVDRDGDGVMEFARYIISDDATRDGLFWAEDDSPMGIRLARASLDGYATADGDQPPVPHSGYYFRLLDGQGETAPGGRMDYVVNGNMVGGHALLAVPAIYGETGVMSFLVSENGIILQADLGENTLDIALDTILYDPGDDWVPVYE